MSKSLYNIDLKDLENNQKIVGAFIIKSFTLAQDRNKQNYGDIILSNKHGNWIARYWRISDEVIKDFQDNDILLISGTVSEYQNTKQITINKTKVPDEGQINEDELVRHSRNDVTVMFNFMLDIIKNIPEDDENLKYLKAVTTRVLEKNSYLFKTIGGSKTNHHNYRAGLLEHSYDVLLNVINDVHIYGYKNINEHLLYCGAILHDIGKIREYKYNSFGIVSDYTREGILLGHISIGVMEIELAAKELADEGILINREVLTDLQHLILSHHGQLEYGSPKLPSMKEAELLFRADCRDAFMEMFDEATDAAGDNEFTSRQYALSGRQITTSIFNKTKSTEVEVGNDEEF